MDGSGGKLEDLLGALCQEGPDGKLAGHHQLARHAVAEAATALQAQRALGSAPRAQGASEEAVDARRTLFAERAARTFRDAAERLGLENVGSAPSVSVAERIALADSALSYSGSSVTSRAFEDHHADMRRTVADFVNKELLPHSAEWDEAESFPREVFQRAGALGLFALKFPAEVGGSGPDVIADAVVTEGLTGCASGGVAAALGAHKDLAALYIYNFGTRVQHDLWLRPLLSGDSIGALAVTEPDAGSDVAAIKTSARRDGDDWLIDGTKHFITNGAWADTVVVAARTDPSSSHGGLTLFVVDTDSPGFTARRMPMVGWRASQTGELHFNSVRVPDEARLGAPGTGFYAIMRNFAWERIVMALGQAAASQRILASAISFASERKVFGRQVADFEVWRDRLARAAASADAGTALVYACLEDVASGGDPMLLAPMAKAFTSEVCCELADMSMQIHGGAGYARGSVERAWRDARLGPIGGGTTEIMREIIGKLLMP